MASLCLCVWHSYPLTTILYILSPSDTAVANEEGALRYLPGKSRSHHLEMMMSKEELEEEQRSVYTCRSKNGHAFQSSTFTLTLPAASLRQVLNIPALPSCAAAL